MNFKRIILVTLIFCVVTGAIFFGIKFIHQLQLSTSFNSRSQTAALSDFTGSLIGYWTFDSGLFGSGAGGVIDSSGNGNNGTFTQYTTGATLPNNVTGKIGQAMQYNQDGADTTKGVYVNVSNPTSFNVGTGDFTVSTWYKGDGVNSGDTFMTLFAKDTTGTTGIYLVVNKHSGGGLVLAGSAGKSITGNIDVTDNSWHLLTLVRQSGTGHLYIDGTLNVSGDLSGNTDVTGETLRLGALSTGPWLAFGSQDDTRFYSSALLAGDVTELYNYTGSGGITYNLTVTSSNGTVTSSPSGISCGSTCSNIFNSGTSITLSASPSTGYTFSGWSGGGCSGTGTCIVTLGANTSVTATFTQNASQASGNIYITQTTQGNDSGSDCSNAHSVSWLNSSSNWGSSAGKVGPGTIAHLCGTITSPINIQGSGTIGNPITILFETNAVMTAPVWPVGTASKRYAIYANGTSYITIDGGTNGVITSTDNGTNLNNQLYQSGVYFTQVDNGQVKNLTVSNMYVRLAGSDDVNGSDGIDYFYGSHVKINNNTLINCGNCINYGYLSASASTDLQVYNNTISHASIELQIGSGGNGATIDTVSVYNNDISDNTTTWDCISNNPTANCLLVRQNNHQNGMHIFAAQTGSNITNLRIYNNYLHGDIGQQSTAWIFLEGYITGALVYNNLFNITNNAPSNGSLAFRGCPGCKAFNNTFISSIAGTAFTFSAWLGNETGIMFMNNIIYGYGQSISDNTGIIPTGYLNAGASYLLQALANSNDNIFYNSSIPVRIGSNSISNDAYTTSQNLAAWINVTGFDAQSIVADPLFISSSDFHLQSASPAISVGANLTSVGVASLDIDRDGVTRPSSGAWDIGAYQCVGTCGSTASNIYISQSGSGDGSSCVSAHSVAWFNSSSNWGSSVGKIGPGVTVHLCGTITSTLSVQGSGSVGNPVTIHFETNAKMSSPAWGIDSSAAIYFNGPFSYITVDGGTNGIIENTANGTALANQIGSEAIVVQGRCSNCEIKNLIIRNLYIRTPNSADPNGSSYAIFFVGGGDHVKIHDNTLSDIGDPIYYLYPTGNSTDVSVYNNTISNSSDDISILAGNSGAHVDGVYVYGNNLSDAAPIWDGVWAGGNHNHNDGIHVGATSPSTSMTNLKVYNNFIHGNWGAYSTGSIFVEGYTEAALVYNNVLSHDIGTPPPNNGYIVLKGGNNAHVLNNTIVSGETTPTGIGVGYGGYTDYESGVVIENNIFHNLGFPIYVSTTTPSGAAYSIVLSDHNIFYSSAPGMLMGEYQIGDFAAWKTLGFDANSTTTDPLFTNYSIGDYTLQSSSSAIGFGANLSSYFSTDKNGVSRPGSAAWDVGAYQYCISSCTPLLTYSITPTAGSNGSISPSTVVNVTSGSSQSFTVTPSTGYQVASILVDGVNASLTGNTYTFSNVVTSHTIAATFSAIPSSGGTSNTVQYSSSGGGGGGGYIPPVSTTTVTSATTVPGCPRGLICTPVGSGVLRQLFTPITQTLYQGSSGPQVTTLQKILVSQNLLLTKYVTGYYGSLTTTAVQAFQKKQGIVSSGLPTTTGYGMVGLKTRTAINTSITQLNGGVNIVKNTLPPVITPAKTIVPAVPTTFTRNLTLGSTGTDVKALQIYLNTHDYIIATSGNGSPGSESTYFGIATKNALIKFQIANRITPALGYFGVVTRGVVNSH